MNAYYIDAGEYTVHECVEHESMACYEYPWRATAIICAPTRGRAKTLFFRNSDFRHAFEWTSPTSIRLLARDVEQPEGDTGDFALWLHAHRLTDDDGDNAEWLDWEIVGMDLYYDEETANDPYNLRAALNAGQLALL